jgi:DNA mismatch endonuclease (patch repair protein)
MPKGVYERSPEHSEKLSIMGKKRKGVDPWNKGKKGVMPVPWNKGVIGYHIHDDEFKARVAIYLGKRERTEEEKRKISIGQKEHCNKPEIIEERRKRKQDYWDKMSKEERTEACKKWFTAAHNVNISSVEKAIYKELNSLNIYFISHYQIYVMWVDVYVPKYNLVIEVDGCYWHGCKKCGFDDERAKEARKKDRQRDYHLKNEGYKIVRIKEHDIKKDARKALVLGLKEEGIVCD